MIALIIYILIFNTIYDSYAIVDSTNWTIFYFVSTYISYGLIAIKATEYANSSYIYLCWSIAIMYFIRAIVELTKIGTPYQEYYNSVNSMWSNISYTLILTGLILSFYARKKAHNK